VTAPTKPCKDCVTEVAAGAARVQLTRKAPHPGPRCRTHFLAKRRADRIGAHNRRLVAGFSIDRPTYDRLKEHQGGVCAICRVAKGVSKNLAVDHDHACCIGPTSCGRCVRGLLCSTCNDILAHFRDNPVALERAADYLRHWPSEAAGITAGKEGIRRV